MFCVKVGSSKLQEIIPFYYSYEILHSQATGNKDFTCRNYKISHLRKSRHFYDRNFRSLV